MAGKVPLGLQRPDLQQRLGPGCSCWRLTGANQPPPLDRNSFHQVWDTGYTGKHSSQQRRKGKETYPRKKEKHMAIEKEFCGLRGEDCFIYQENSARHKEPLLVGCCQPCLVYTRILLRNKAGNGEGEISGLQTLFPYHLPPSALVRSGGPLPSPSLWSPEASALPASPTSCGTHLFMMPQVTITKGAGLGAENTALIGLCAVALG